MYYFPHELLSNLSFFPGSVGTFCCIAVALVRLAWAGPRAALCRIACNFSPPRMGLLRAAPCAEALLWVQCAAEFHICPVYVREEA